MVAWLQSFVLNFVLGLILKVIHQAEGKIDWAALEVELDAKIKTILPGDFLDAEGVAFVNNCIAILKDVLDGDMISQVLGHLVKGEFALALEAIKSAIVGAVMPQAAVASGEELNSQAVRAISLRAA